MFRSRFSRTPITLHFIFISPGHGEKKTALYSYNYVNINRDHDIGPIENGRIIYQADQNINFN